MMKGFITVAPLLPMLLAPSNLRADPAAEEAAENAMKALPDCVIFD